MARTQLGTSTGAAAGRRALPAEPAARRITRDPGLPGGRAALGALLVTVAAVGTFVAAGGGDGDPGDPVVVARHDLRRGEELAASDLTVERATLPGGAAGFAEVADLLGRVTLGPIAAGEIVQGASVTDDGAPSEPLHEVALVLPRDRLAVGRLRAGDRVDVFATWDDRTELVVGGAEVVQLLADDEATLASAREVELVVAVGSADHVAVLVHALRTSDITVVRSTFAEEQPAPEDP